MNFFSFVKLSPLGAYHSLMYGNSMYFDIRKAKAELDWCPKYSNEDMIKESYDWYVSNRDRILNSSDSVSIHKSKVKQGILFLVGKLL